MPRISVIRANGTGDYTTLQAWASAEGNVNYGAITVARLDGFFDVSTSNVDLIATWPNGARFECFDPSNGFNGTRRQLCGITGSGSQTLRNRGKNVELHGLELYNTGTGLPYSNTTTGGTFSATECLFRDLNSSLTSAVSPNTTLGPGLFRCVVDSASRCYTPPITMDRCTVLGNSVAAIGTTSDTKIISNTVTTNKQSGLCYRLEVVQTNCASTDTTAFAFPSIVVATEFVNADPAVSGDYRLKSGSNLAANGIGAFVQAAANQKPVITLLGDNPLSLPFNQPYAEPGFQAIDPEDGNITGSVVVTGTVNHTVAGIYNLFYNVTDSGGLAADQVTRVVEVLAPVNTKPVIVLLGDNPLNLAFNQPYVEPGFVAVDNEDGDITVNVVVTGTVDHTVAGTYTLFYDVTDSGGLAADQVSRTVIVAAYVNQKPVIELFGSNPLNLPVGEPYVEPGYQATDFEDGDLTGSVIVTGSVNELVIGQYQLKYNVIDLDGLAANEVTRVINVVALASTLNMTLQGIPDGPNATRVIDPVNGGAVLFIGNIEWANGVAQFNANLPPGAILHYYAIGMSSRGINIGVTV